MYVNIDENQSIRMQYSEIHDRFRYKVNSPSKKLMKSKVLTRPDGVDISPAKSWP